MAKLRKSRKVPTAGCHVTVCSNFNLHHASANTILPPLRSSLLERPTNFVSASWVDSACCASRTESPHGVCVRGAKRTASRNVSVGLMLTAANWLDAERGCVFVDLAWRQGVMGVNLSAEVPEASQGLQRCAAW